MAGMASLFLIMEINSLASCKFWGYGIPCANRVDSNATTGLRNFTSGLVRAVDTSGSICIGCGL